MRRHGMLDLINDGPSSRFDTQDLGHFHDVIRRRVFAHNTWGLRRSQLGRRILSKRAYLLLSSLSVGRSLRLGVPSLPSRLGHQLCP
jgi:hypothetical protein